jgi:GNAT superfamily N-acetyltransferase
MTPGFANKEPSYRRRRGPTPPLALPRGGSVVLRPVEPTDEEFLLKLYSSSREQELAQVEWAEGQKEVFLRWQFELQQREYESRFPESRYDVLVVDGEAAGRIWVGADDLEIRLLDIAISPNFQNRGVGTVLIKQLIDEARLSRKRLRHMVFVLNNNAHRFYERLGFVMIEDMGAYKHMEWRGELAPESGA